MLREMGIPPFWPVEDATASSASPASPPSEAPPPAMVAQPVVQAPRADVSALARSAVTVVAAPPASLKPADADPARPARPAGIEVMDWPDLRQAVAGCQACALCESRRQTVFGVGHIEAQWMIVGEAPGEQEDQQGEPFVGRAGQLLDRMLDAIDLTRSEAPAARQVFIANVLKCRPPANRNPLPQEVAQCEPYLLRQIALVQPKVILAMGRFAVQSLLKTTEAIGRLRGRVHEVQGIPVVVTYHPAYLLRNPADKALVWDDLCLAREVWAQAMAPSRA
ncbi:MAG: uracil-DNA glycosylase [Acidobacteriota bacterium]